MKYIHISILSSGSTLKRGYGRKQQRYKNGYKIICSILFFCKVFRQDRQNKKGRYSWQEITYCKNKSILYKLFPSSHFFTSIRLVFSDNSVKIFKSIVPVEIYMLRNLITAFGRISACFHSIEHKLTLKTIQP